MQYIIDGILLFLASEPMMGDRSLSLPNQFETQHLSEFTDVYTFH